MAGFAACRRSVDLASAAFCLRNRGTSGIDIDLRRVDIDQCPQRIVPGVTQPLNLFAGTDKCKHRTTEVRFSG